MHPLARLVGASRPLVMGILNVTPDSFYDGGRFDAPSTAIEHAQALVRAGADLLDVGAESTRPYGSVQISPDEEWNRLAPVVPHLSGLGVPWSVDTMNAATAERALAAGASIVNDVWGLQRDPAMAAVIAKHDAAVIVMHNRETADPAIDIHADIDAFLARSIKIAASARIARDRIVIDPGIGFGKTPAQSIAAIAGLGRLKRFGLPILVGLSRKRFIASVSPSEPDERLGGSIAANLAAVRAGAIIVRVHDVAETVQALRVQQAIDEAQ